MKIKIFISLFLTLAIEAFLNQLEDPDTSQKVRTQILCKDYSGEYKKNYMPALLNFPQLTLRQRNYFWIWILH